MVEVSDRLVFSLSDISNYGFCCFLITLGHFFDLEMSTTPGQHLLHLEIQPFLWKGSSCITTWAHFQPHLTVCGLLVSNNPIREWAWASQNQTRTFPFFRLNHKHYSDNQAGFSDYSGSLFGLGTFHLHKKELVIGENLRPWVLPEKNRSFPSESWKGLVQTQNGETSSILNRLRFAWLKEFQRGVASIWSLPAVSPALLGFSRKSSRNRRHETISTAGQRLCHFRMSSLTGKLITARTACQFLTGTRLWLQLTTLLASSKLTAIMDSWVELWRTCSL